MKLSTTLCLALVVAMCYLVESSPVKTDGVTQTEKEIARQSGPIVSPPVPGGSDDDDDDDGSTFFSVFANYFIYQSLVLR